MSQKDRYFKNAPLCCANVCRKCKSDFHSSVHVTTEMHTRLFLMVSNQVLCTILLAGSEYMSVDV